MMRFWIEGILFYFVFIIGCQNSQGQSNELHVLAGMANYQGDLQPKGFTTQSAGKSFGIIYKRGVFQNLFIRAGLSFSNFSAADSINPSDGLRLRNLSFKTNITDFNVALEYRFLNPEKFRIHPFVFIGVGGFSFNPYVNYGTKNEKVYLQPLSTEGQGLPQYPERKVYKLTQFNVPFGGGFIWQVNDQIMLGAEIRQYITYTDYLDDVSTTYVNQNDLLNAKGQLAVDLAYRRDELDGRPYPNNGATRGEPKNNDWYYYVGLTFGYRFGGYSGGKAYKNQLGCPKW